MIEGSCSGAIPLINRSGSGSRRPKNIWILRIRIHNTGFDHITLYHLTIKIVLVLMLTLSNKTSSVVPRPPRRCKLDRDCGDPDACIMSLCTNPCLTSNPCDASAICKPFNKTAYCYCPEGHVGDPYIQCLLAPEPGE
jgi:hypothetical protein